MADAELRAVLLPKSELARQDGPLSLRVSAGPGSGQRPEAAEKEMVGICSQGRKWTNCRGGAGMAAGMSPPDPLPTPRRRAKPGSAWCLGQGALPLLGGSLPHATSGPSYRLLGRNSEIDCKGHGAVGQLGAYRGQWDPAPATFRRELPQLPCWAHGAPEHPTVVCLR